MNHQPFETWILTKEPLPEEQAQVLQAHLANCPACQHISTAWSDMDHILRAMPSVQPAVGFTSRWQSHLATRALQDRLLKQHRQSWWLLLLSIGGAAVLLSLLVINFLVYDSPTNVLIAVMYQVISLVSLTRAVQEILTTIVRMFMAIVPPVYWLVISGGLGLLSMLWIFSLRKIIHPMEVRR